MQSGIEIIATERQRQIEEEGWTAKHDSEHAIGEMAMAAACYAMIPAYRPLELAPLGWPWLDHWWKPRIAKDSSGRIIQTEQMRIRELAKAGALIAAEIDRLNNSSNE